MDNINTASERLQTIAPAIAAELNALTNGGYEVEQPRRPDGIPYTHHIDLVAPGGVCIGLSVTYRPGNTKGDKVHVSGRLDGYMNGRQIWWASQYRGEVNPSANIAMTKSPKAIAAAIARRVLPEYLKLLERCEEAKRTYIEDTDSALKVAQELAAVVGAPIDSRDTYEPRLDLYRSTKLPEFSADIKVSNDRVSFDRLSVSPDAAREILEVLIRHHVKA